MTTTEGIDHQTGVLERVGEPDLVWQGFLPRAATDSPPPILAFVHGLAEHFGRYDRPVGHFTSRGFPCYGLDLRGHGRSEGRRAHVDRFADYQRDVDALVDFVAARHPESPIILVGHSMGGVVAVLYAAQLGHKLRGLILSSPGFAAHPDSAPSPLLLRLGRIASRIAPRLHFATGLDPSFVSRDPEVVAAYRSDPLVTAKVTARWATEFLAAQNRCFQVAPELRLSTLVMQSGADRLVDPAATNRWASLVDQTFLSAEPWPDLFHEMFNEPERRQVFEKMDEWIDALP